jgi:endonuclease/exonuclease/phosphatase family metal-dependent hydrolase
VRIGTWNLEGRWKTAHRAFLAGLDCDVLLVTEVRSDIELPGYCRHLTTVPMAPGRAWAGVLSRTPLAARADPHPASALASGVPIGYCSSVLPWRSCGTRPPWSEGTVGQRVDAVLDGLRAALAMPLVWGGDFNHALEGPEHAGSRTGRASIRTLLDDLGLRAVTSSLPHRLGGNSIDHIALPSSAVVHAVDLCDARTLSDHDAYLVDFDL